MAEKLNVLILEDNPSDAELLLIELRRAGYEPTSQIVDNEKDFSAHLNPGLDLILSDYSLPQFNGLEALQIRNESGFDIPFIIVSGTIGEDIAIESIHQGADDYLMKDRMKRLGSAVANAIKKKELRDEQKQAQQEIELLLELSRQAGAETRLDDLLFFIANKIVEVIPPAESSSVFLYDEERKVVRVQAWAGFNDSEIEGLEFSFDGHQVGGFFQTKKPSMIKDVSKDPEFKQIDKPSLKITKSQIAMPLIFKKQVIGIIFADNLTRTDAFSQKDLNLLESIGNQLSGVIENAHLLDQVKKSEEYYQSVVEDSPGIIDKFLPDGTITFVNQEFCRFFGKTPEEVIGTKMQSLIFEENRENVMSNLASLTEDSPVQIFENKNIRHDGEIRWMRWVDRALFDDRGKITGFQTFGEDITERKQVELALRGSEERFRAFMEHVPAFAYILNKDLRHIYGNPASIAADGYSTLESYIGTSIQNNYPDEISNEIEANSKKVLDEGCITNHEFSVVMQDGKTHTLLDIKFPIQLPGGNTQVGGLSIDVTEMKAAQKAVHEEQERAQKYLDIAEVMIVALNKEGEITLVNQKGASLLGYQIEELIGKNWFNTCILKSEKKRAHRVFDDFIAGEAGWGDHFEQVVITKSGEERIIDWHSTPLWKWNGDVKHRIGSLSSREDITKRVQALKKLQESEKYQKAIFETTSVATIIIEEDTTISMANNEFEKLSGYSKEELEGRISWSVFVAEEDLKKMQGYHQQRRIDPDTTIKQYEFQFINREGIIRNILAHVDMIPGTKKSVASFLDFTERARMEQLLSALNRAAVAMGTSQTHQDIFNAVSEELKQLDISCMLFPIDEAQSRLITKYISYETALLNAAEKLAGIIHGDFSFPIDTVDMYREVVRDKKTFFSDSSAQTFQQIVPKLPKNILPKIVRLLRVEKSISVPLIVEDQVIGVFSIQSDTLTREDIPTATAFADQLSSAWNKIKLLKNLRKTVESTIHTIAATVEARDPYTAGHQKRVADLAAAIAIEMKLTDEQVEGIKMAGIIHDLGKIKVPAEILSKPGTLNELEYQIVQTHSQVGFELLNEIEFPWPIAEIVHQHHEKMDGSGYPQGLKGDEILLEARILSVADIVEAMSSHRPYRPALGIEKALKQIKKDKGTLLDSKVVNACLKIFKEGYKLLEI